MPRHRLSLLPALAFVAAVAACHAGEARQDTASATPLAESAVKPVEDTSYKLAPGYTVDSVHPVEEELRRFREGLGPAPTRLLDGAPSMDSLIHRFAADVERADTNDLRALHVTRAEYAWLLYPESPFTHPPYRQPPDLAWMLLREGSVKGLTRLMTRRGGKPLGLVRWECDHTPVVEGRSRYFKQCVLHTAGPAGSARAERLFGTVVERDGTYKIASYANEY